jgi:hypothetical protein
MLLRVAAAARRLQERVLPTDSPVTSQILDLASRYVFVDSGKAVRELGYRVESVDAGIAAALAELAESRG